MISSVRRAVSAFLPVQRFSPGDRRLAVVMWVTGLIQGFAQSQATSTLPFTRSGLGLTEGEMSLLLGLARLAAFAALPLGWLADRHGRRRPLLWAVALIVVGGAAAGLAVEAWHFGLAHSVLRTGTAALTGLAIVLLAEQISPPVRAYAISLYGAAVSFGGGLALITLPLAENGPGAWRIPHLLTGVGLLLVPFLVKRVPESRIFEVDPGGNTGWAQLLQGGWAKRFWIVMVVAFLLSAFSVLAIAFTTERLINQLEVATGTVVLITLGGGTLGGIGFFAGGHLADSWGRRRTSVLSLVLACAGGVLLYWSEGLFPILVAMVMSTFGTFAFVPSGGSHRAELFPTALRSKANTATANSSLAGSAAGLLLGTLTIDTFGIPLTVTALGAGVLIGAMLTLALPETLGQDLTAISTDLG